MKPVRNDGSVLGVAAIGQLGALRADMLRLSAGMIFHASASDEVGLPDKVVAP